MMNEYDNISDLVSNCETAHIIDRGRLKKHQAYIRKHLDKTVLSQKLQVSACVYLFCNVYPQEHLANCIENGKVIFRFVFKWAMFHIYN